MFPFAQRLTKDEKNKLAMEYGSLEYGYLILYFQAEFKKRGYQVSIDRERLRKSDYVFDFCIHDENTETFVDIDKGTLSQQDFSERMNKICRSSKTIYLAAKDEMTLYRSTLPNAFRWINEHFGGIANAKGNISLHVTTLEWCIVGEEVWKIYDI